MYLIETYDGYRFAWFDEKYAYIVILTFFIIKLLG